MKKKNKEDDGILKELQRISKLLAMQVTQDKNKKDSIATLLDAGFEPTEIAGLLGMTIKLVHSNISAIRKNIQKAKKKKSKKAPKGEVTDVV